MLSTLRVVEGAIVTVSGVLGVEVGTERLWRRCDELGLSRLLLVNLLDRERADFFATLEALQTRLSTAVRGRRDPDRAGARVPGRGRSRAHGRLPARRRRRPRRAGRHPGRHARGRRRVPRQADGHRRRDLGRADGALPRGRRDQPRGDGPGAQEPRDRGRAVPGRLWRGHPQHRLARAARPDRRGPAVAQPRPQRARGGGRDDAGVHLQDDRRPLQRQDQPAARLRRHAHVRLDAHQQPHPLQGAHRPAAGAAGQGAHAGRLAAERRDRRGRQAQGDRHRRRPLRRRHPGRDRAAGVPVPGGVVRDRAQAQGRGGEGAHVASAAAGGGSLPRRPPRPADGRDDRRRPLADARRGDARADAPPVRGRGGAAPAAGAVHGDDPPARPGAGPLQEADRRPRPVRRLPHHHRAAVEPRGLRVRRQDRRRRHPPGLPARRRQGHPGGHAPGRAGRMPHRRA